MSDGQFADGAPQSFYFLLGYQLKGAFKGMIMILEE